MSELEKKIAELEELYEEGSISAGLKIRRYLPELISEIKHHHEINGMLVSREIELRRELDAANARAEKAEAVRDEPLAVAALARKLAQATRGWAKAGNVDNSAEYWTAWAYADAQEAAKAVEEEA